MIREPFKTTEIQIGKEGNKIYHHPDGDMMFRDDFVPGIKLKDLSGLSDVVILDPAVIVSINEGDWQIQTISGQTLYFTTVNTGMDIEPEKYFVEINNIDHEKIQINNIKKNTTNIVLSSTVPLDMYVQIKRIS